MERLSSTEFWKQGAPSTVRGQATPSESMSEESSLNSLDTTPSQTPASTNLEEQTGKNHTLHLARQAKIVQWSIQRNRECQIAPQNFMNSIEH